MTSATPNPPERRSSLRVTVPSTAFDTDDVSPIADVPSDDSPPDFAGHATEGAHEAPTVAPGNTSGTIHPTVHDTSALSVITRIVEKASKVCKDIWPYQIGLSS